MLVYLCISYLGLAHPTNNSQLDSLLVSARISRGYLPHTFRARKAKLTAELANQPFFSVQLQRAMKAKMLASFKFVKLMMPFYRQLNLIWAGAALADRRSSRRVPKRLKTTIGKELQAWHVGVVALTHSLVNLHGDLPFWEQLSGLVSESLSDLEDAYVLLEKACVKMIARPTLASVEEVYQNLYLSCFKEVLKLFEKHDSKVSDSVRNRLPQAEYLKMTSHFLEIIESLGLVKLLSISWLCHHVSLKKLLAAGKQWRSTSAPCYLIKRFAIQQLGNAICWDSGNLDCLCLEVSSCQMTGPISYSLFDQAHSASAGREAAVKHVCESVKGLKSVLPNFSLVAKPSYVIDLNSVSRRARVFKLAYGAANEEYCRLRAAAVRVALQELSDANEQTV